MDAGGEGGLLALGHAAALRPHLIFVSAGRPGALDNATIVMDGVNALNTSITKPAGYWQHLEQVISAEVETALGKSEDARRPLVTYLRDLEEVARAEGGQRQTVQVIVSGRRLLGDQSNIGSADEPFPRLTAFAP